MNITAWDNQRNNVNKTYENWPMPGGTSMYNHNTNFELAKKVLKEVFMPVSQQVKRNEKRRMKDLDKSMKSRMTPSEKAAYNRKYPNEKIK